MSFTETFVEFLNGIPPQLATLLLAALPVGELRGALPVALVVYKLSLPSALFWSILGNMLPIYFILLLLERVSTWLSARSALCRRFFTWLFERTRKKLEVQVKRYGVWALIIFVAIPLPATGAWSGAAAAFVFGLPRKKAFLAILAGVLIAAAVVTILTVGTTTTIDALTAT